MTGMKRKPLPFSVNRNDARSLVDQVADGMRQAIVSGHWRVGDELPSTRELVPLLGVSHIVTRAALSRLSDEGYVLTRHGLHPMVRDRGAKQWIGHVVLVCPEGDDNYLQTILAGALRDRLLAAGYLFTQICVRRDQDGKFDFSYLDAALSRSVDLAIVMYDHVESFRHLARKGIPYAALRDVPEMPKGAVGFTHLNLNMAVETFVEECSKLGVEKVVQINWDRHLCDVSSACRSAGLDVKTVNIPIDKSAGRLLNVKRAGFEAFSQLIADAKLRHPTTVYFISDDYLAAGALLAIADAGLDIPADIRFATWANAGLGPFFKKELSRMEFDPAAAGATIAAAALQYLDTDIYPSGTSVGPRWISGETLGAAFSQTTQGDNP